MHPSRDVVLMVIPHLHRGPGLHLRLPTHRQHPRRHQHLPHRASGARGGVITGVFGGGRRVPGRPRLALRVIQSGAERQVGINFRLIYRAPAGRRSSLKLSRTGPLHHHPAERLQDRGRRAEIRRSPQTLGVSRATRRVSSEWAEDGLSGSPRSGARFSSAGMSAGRIRMSQSAAWRAG